MNNTAKTTNHSLGRRAVLALGTAAFLVMPMLESPADAGTVTEPKGKIILTIDGRISNTNADGAINFDLAQIEALPKVTFTTTTPWTDGATRFEGVLLRDLLKAAGADGRRLKAVALNDYASEIPASDAEKHEVIVAYKSDGKYMPVRSKGPLWVMYPFDDDPTLKNEKVYARSVWQLRRLSVIN